MELVPWLKGLVWSALIGLLGSLLHYRRDRELDQHGNPCLRYFVPRYFIPLSCIWWLVIAVKNLSDPFHQRYPENSVVEFGFATLSLVASLWFVPYRIAVVAETTPGFNRAIERSGPPIRCAR